MSSHNSAGTLSRRSLLAGAGAAAVSVFLDRRAVLTRMQETQVQLPADLRQALPGMMEIAGVPAFSMATVEGEGIATLGVGLTTSDGTPVNPETVFEAASLGKPVFAWLVLLLAAEGVLDLDRPLHQYLPLPYPDDQSARTITARHLLSHSSGWRNWRNTPRDSLTADREPGKRFTYSGEGFYFLSRVLAKLSGKGILQLTRERIFVPMGMERSSYIWLPTLDGNRAEPHTSRGMKGESYNARTGRMVYEAARAAGKNLDAWTHEEGMRLLQSRNADVPALPNFMAPNVAGSLMTTARDYALFLRHILGAEGREILRRMTEPQVRLNAALEWGLGVGLQTDNGRTRFWHWGDNFGFKNFLIGEPDRRTALVIFTNGQNGRAIYERIVRAMWGDQKAFLWI